MLIESVLPRDRYAEGRLWWSGDMPPRRCRGEADNTAAQTAGNPRETPTRRYGDHPAGRYRIIVIVPQGGEYTARYGPFFVALRPLSGEALAAADAGRKGLGIHGGRLHPDGRLRETYGCLRVDDETITDLVTAIRAAWDAEETVEYECRVE